MHIIICKKMSVGFFRGAFIFWGIFFVVIFSAYRNINIFFYYYNSLGRSGHWDEFRLQVIYI